MTFIVLQMPLGRRDLLLLLLLLLRRRRRLWLPWCARLLLRCSLLLLLMLRRRPMHRRLSGLLGRRERMLSVGDCQDNRRAGPALFGATPQPRQRNRVRRACRRSSTPFWRRMGACVVVPVSLSLIHI